MNLMKWRSVLAAAGMGLALAVPTARASSESKIYLSWHAPYGAPRASSTLTVACGDTTRVDTLYMTCDIGTDSPTFLGFQAILTFHLLAGDTLGPSWDFGNETTSPRGVRAIWEADSSLVVRPPWGGVQGQGAIYYVHTRLTGSLRMGFAIPIDQALPVHFADRVLLARVLFQHPAAGTGCDQPVCIAWDWAGLSFAAAWESEITSGDRFVSWNSPGGRVCAPFSSARAPRPWKPPGGSAAH